MPKTQYSLLFNPIKIGNTTIPNRLFFPPWCFNWANDDGTISDKLYDLYIDLAKGGNGMVITGCAAVSPDSLLYRRSMRIYRKEHTVRLKTLCRDMLALSCIPSIQLMNFGRQSITTFTGEPVYGPSAIPCPVKSKKDPNYAIREMTIEDIQRVKNDFVRAARLSVEAGFKVIQIHAAHGFLLNQFLSPYSNHRTDMYGGSIENRARFVVEVISEVKKVVQNDAAIDIRISAHEFVEDGLEPFHFKEIIPLFEKAGADMINVSFSISETTGIMFKQPINPQGRYAHLAKEIKQYTTVPVAYTGFIADLKHAEEIMHNNELDLIGIGRGQFADPYMINKYAANEDEMVNKCKFDNNCLFSFSGKAEDQVFCIVNPKYKRPKQTENGETRENKIHFN